MAGIGREQRRGPTAGAREQAPRLAIDELQPIDFVVSGSVAVNRQGDRNR